MKTTLKNSLVALFTLITTAVFAQEGNGNGNSSNTGTTNLTVNVAELYSIVVDANASINLATQNDFLEGAKSGISNMKVFASKSYKITATAAAEKFSTNTSGVTETPAVNNIDILLSKQGNTTVIGQTALSHNGSTLYSSTSGENHTDFNVEYAIPAANTDAFLTSGGQSLNTVITYTITAS